MRKVNCIEGNLFTIGLAADPSCFLISYHTLTMRSFHMTCSPSHMCTLYLTSVCIAGKEIHKQNQNNPLPSEDERFSASSLIRPYARSWTPVVSMVSELKQNSPSSSSPSLLRFSPLPGPSPPLLSPFIFFSVVCFVLFFPFLFDAPTSTTTAPLNCPTSNSSTVQVDIFPMSPAHTDVRAHKQKQSCWMEQLPGRLAHSSIIGKKLADLIKDHSVKERTGYPD